MGRTGGRRLRCPAGVGRGDRGKRHLKLVFNNVNLLVLLCELCLQFMAILVTHMALDDKISQNPVAMLILHEILILTFSCHVAIKSRCFVNKDLCSKKEKKRQ